LFGGTQADGIRGLEQESGAEAPTERSVLEFPDHSVHQAQPSRHPVGRPIGWTPCAPSVLPQ
jgi:hypothetical protein